MANRYFLPELPCAGAAEVGGELAHHVGRVLRLRAGERITLGDGIGGSAVATVLGFDRHVLRLDVAASTRHEPVLPQVTLAFALPRAARAEWLFEHGTEVGVAHFQPLWTQRTRPQGERHERWRKIVLAAAGQCDRAWLPEVLAPMELGDWLASADLPARRLLAAADAAPLAAPGAAPMVLLVGPEGGFAANEVASALAAGFTPVGLGPHILRTETAALVGAAMLLAGSR